jgi:hypothetical protein
LENDGAAKVHASVSASGSNGNGGLTRLNPDDFEQFKLLRRAQRAGGVPWPVPRSLAVTGVEGGPG